jgi:hypothetical protein
MNAKKEKRRMRMTPQLFGKEHILYILISTLLATAVLLAGKKLASSARTQTRFL